MLFMASGLMQIWFMCIKQIIEIVTHARVFEYEQEIFWVEADNIAWKQNTARSDH